MDLYNSSADRDKNALSPRKQKKYAKYYSRAKKLSNFKLIGKAKKRNTRSCRFRGIRQIIPRRY